MLECPRMELSNSWEATGPKQAAPDQNQGVMLAHGPQVSLLCQDCQDPPKREVISSMKPLSPTSGSASPHPKSLPLAAEDWVLRLHHSPAGLASCQELCICSHSEKQPELTLEPSHTPTQVSLPQHLHLRLPPLFPALTVVQPGLPAQPLSTAAPFSMSPSEDIVQM